VSFDNQLLANNQADSPVSSSTVTQPEETDPPQLTPPTLPTIPAKTPDLPTWLTVTLLAVILIIGAYFRFTGVDWDSGRQLHPDERFIANVAGAIRPVANLFDYFDTEHSTLNPFPYGSYTYGMFPLFLGRYVAEAIGMTDGERLVLVGRVLSGLFDLISVALLYLLGARLYNRRVGLLAAALSAAAVLPIQLSHYFTVDSFATPFILLAFLVAEPTLQRGSRWHYLVFGLATGLAMACKINTAPVAAVIVVTGSVRLLKGLKQNSEPRKSLLSEVIVGWLIAGAAAAITFRIFQPYAFTGPGFFDIGLNQRWLDIIHEVTDQVAGKADYPPNHHWTNRSQLTFAWIQNAGWGVGLPLGIVATLAWVWAAWRIWRDANLTKGTWQSHLLLVLWVGGYFAWQNAQFWRYMRYFMPIYPFAILLAAWAMIALLDKALALPREARTIRQLRQRTLLQVMAISGVVIVTLATYTYAFAFTRIYTRTHTRVVASDWILENIPGPLNFKIQTSAGLQNQPYAIPYDLVLRPGEPWRQVYKPIATGEITQINTFRIQAPDTSVYIKIGIQADGSDTITEGRTTIAASDSDPAKVVLFNPIDLSSGQVYYVHYTVQSNGAFMASDLALADDQTLTLSIPDQINVPDSESASGSFSFTPAQTIHLDRLDLGVTTVSYPTDPSTIRLTLSHDSEGKDPIASSEVTVTPGQPSAEPIFNLPSPLAVDPSQPYFISLELLSGSPVTLSGATLAMETSWDDSLPLRSANYDPFGGIYRASNLELFEQDTPVKRTRMLDVLANSDYVIVSSNRGYDAMPRLPLRYPLTLKYYQALFNCDQQLIINCAYPAQVGLPSQLDYELVAVFENNPNLGPLEFSDQWAEEAFTVYDHPKVMIFKRAANYSSQKTADLLNSVDLTQVVEQSPAQYTAMPGLLLLNPQQLVAQTQGGTWSELFDPNSPLNTNQVNAVIVWYLLLTLIGWAAWPMVHGAFAGLADRGYPLARFVGLLFITWLAWFGASYQLYQFTRPILWTMVIGFVVLGAYVGYRHRTALAAHFQAHRTHIVIVEGLGLALFLFFLWVRWLNPDLWHPWLGGEKPADFSFFQSAIRSVYFPPYDVWLSGHYVNYYYFGFVIAAVPTKLLGILPAIAYNLVLPTLFSLAGLGAFCAAYNLVAGASLEKLSGRRAPYVAGITAVVLTLLVGNLFQVRQLWQYLPEAADPPASYSENLFDNTLNVFSGAVRVLTGQTGLPRDKGAWYFGPSRAILHDQQDTPITEFPLFSFLYADLHPHLSSISLMLVAMSWMISTVYASASRHPEPSPAPPASSGLVALSRQLTIAGVSYWVAGGLVFGALFPTQTWDFPGFMILGVLSLTAAVWLEWQNVSRASFGTLVIKVGLFVGLALTFYYPFRQNFATDYSAIEYWQYTRTPPLDYLTVHGLFLFVSVTWLAWQTSRQRFPNLPTDYLLNTPLGQLLPRIRWPLILSGLGAAAVLAGAFWLLANDYSSLLIAGPLLLWAIGLFFAPGQTVTQRIWLTLFGVGVGLTILVELINLKGDLGRANTVFKFYIEVWLFFSVTAGAALAWLWPTIRQSWSQRWRSSWLAGLGLLTLTAGIYTVIGIYSKTTDRWPAIDAPPHTLDGMAYMLGSDSRVTGDERQIAYYDDEGTRYDLSNDNQAIRWLQSNVSGTPAIVEGNSALYRWGSRISIYTGLPTVIGWDYHVSQHDSILPGSVVSKRLQAVKDFYNTTDPEEANQFLERYHIEYIIVGQLERKYYAPEGLAKFEEMVKAGLLVRVFSSQTDTPDEATLIYQTAPLTDN
jgi:YYY domain-containing protein